MRLLTLILLLPLVARADLDTAPLESWLKKQAAIQALSADFIQERTLPALKKPTRTPGTFLMAPHGKLRWELGDPVKTVAVSDGTTMTLLDVPKKTARALPADSPRAKQFTLLADGALNGGLEAFQRAFELVESRVTNGIYQITVRPKNRSMREKAPWLFLDIDPRTDELRALEVRLEDESRIRTIFTRSRTNPRIPPGTFDVDLSGYEIN